MASSGWHDRSRPGSPATRPPQRSGSRPRALVAFHLGEMGGPAISLVPSLEWLQREYELEILVPRGTTEVARRFVGLGTTLALDYEAITFPGGALPGGRTIMQIARDIAAFRRHLRASRPEIVIAVTMMLPALLVAARLEGIPTVVYAAELFDRAALGTSRAALGWLLGRATGSLAGGVVCCSAGVARQFDATRNVPVEVAYPPVEVALYADGDGDGFREHHRLVDSWPCMAVVGSLSRMRGQDVAVRALSSIREQLPSVRLLIVGRPHPREIDKRFDRELRQLAGELGVSDAIVFAGFVERIADVYAAADVVVNPARIPEAFGRVAVEALAAGTPVVSSRVGAVTEVLRDGSNALLVPPGDHQALAAAVLALADDARLAARLVHNGRASVGSFTAANSVEPFAQVVASVTGAPRGGRTSDRLVRGAAERE